MSLRALVSSVRLFVRWFVGFFTRKDVSLHLPTIFHTQEYISYIHAQGYLSTPTVFDF